MNDNGGIVSGVLWKFAERILAQIVSLVVSVVLARILLPEDYGIVAMVTVFITVANVFVTSGIPTALIQKKDADNKDFSAVFYFNLFFSLVIYSLIYLAAPYVARFYLMPTLSTVLRVMGLRIIISAINSVQHSYVSRHMMFRKYFWSTLFGTVVSGFIGIVMAYNRFGVWALVAQYMVNTTIDTTVLFFTVEWRPSLYFSWTRIKELVVYGWKVLFEGVSNTIFQQIQSLIIGKVYTSGDLGFYTKAQQFPNLLVTNISVSVSSVLLPTFSNLQDKEYKVQKMLRKSVRLTCFLIVPMLVGLAAVADAFVTVVLTEKWLACVPFMQVYCVVNLAYSMLIPRHQALLGIGRSDIFMYEHIFSRIIQLIILILTFRVSVFAITISTLVGAIIMLFIVAFTSKRFNQYSYRLQIEDVTPSISGSLIMFIIVYPLSFWRISPMLKLIAQMTIGCLVYIMFSIKFNREGIDFSKGLIQKLMKALKKKT